MNMSPMANSRVKASTLDSASSSMAASTPPMVTEPSSSTLMVVPVSSMMARITRPPGPMRAPILLTSIFKRTILGACSLICGRTSEITSFILPMMCSRPWRACSKASFKIAWVR